MSVSTDRRGRYHSLLALLPRIPFPSLVKALAAHFGGAEESGVASFAQSLLAVMTLTKVANVSGNVLILFSDLVLKSSTEEKFQQWIIDPVLNLLLNPDQATPTASASRLATSASNDDDSTAEDESHVVVTAVTAHFITPLLKVRPTTLATIVQPLIKSKNADRRLQAIVEVIHRAVGVGLSPGNLLSAGDMADVSQELNRALTAADPTLRMLSLRLLTLESKHTSQATQLQCNTVSAYVVLHLHNGGDSTTRNNMISFLTQWYHRLISSATSSKAEAKRKTESTSGKKKSQEESAHRNFPTSYV